MAIDRLEKEYPPGTRGIGALTLSEYTAIKAARSHGWRWGEIAVELGKPQSAARAVANAFARVRRRVEAGELVPPGTKKPTAGGATRQGGGGFTNITPKD